MMGKDVRKDYHENGNLWFEYHYEGGKEHGLCRGWYVSGELRYEDTFYKGQLHGVRKDYGKDGKLDHREYWIYSQEVSEEEYRKHILIEKMAGI